MALLFCDGFDHYTSVADLLLKWSTWASSTDIVATGRFGGNCVRVTNENWGVSKNLNKNIATGGVSFAHNFGSFGTVASRLVGLFDGSTLQVDLRVGADGKPYVTRAGTVLGTSSVILTPGWRWFDFKATIHPSAGTVDVWLDGVNIISLTGQNTRASANSYYDIFTFAFLSNSNGVLHYWDDVIAWDDQGSGLVDCPGDCRVQAIFPSGAGATTQMTPSAGNNYACVDEAAPNGDTDYVSETTAGEKDTYAFGNLTSTSGTVKGVQIMINARKDDAGSRSITPVYRPVSTDYDGTTKSVTDSYTYAVQEITEVSPATSVAWTIAEINGAEFGVKLVS